MTPEIEEEPEPEFICPECGGTFFGRDCEIGTDGKVKVTDHFWCHDELGTGCKWHGKYPIDV